MARKVEYIVIDDYGDDWEEGSIAFGPFDTREEADEQAEAENYHSASIVKVVNGKRVEQLR
jgi:hypothetical protein